MPRWLGLVTVSHLWVVLAGCAHVVVDPDGTQHISGLMMLTLPPAHQDVAADVVRMRTFGLTMTRDPTAGAQLTLGYSDTTIAAIRNDAVVSGPALRRAIHEEQATEE